MYVLREKLKLVVVLLIHVFKSSACSNNMPYTPTDDIHILELLRKHNVEENLQHGSFTKALRPVYRAFRAANPGYKSTLKSFIDHWRILVANGSASGKAPLMQGKTSTKYTLDMDEYLLAMERLTQQNGKTHEQHWATIFEKFKAVYDTYSGSQKTLYEHARSVLCMCSGRS